MSLAPNSNNNAPNNIEHLFVNFQNELDAIRIGYLILWENAGLAFNCCGQIGDFIHTKADEQLLRIVIPALIKLHFAIFLFRSKDAAEAFLEKAKEIDGGDGIEAMSLDDLSPTKNPKSLPYTSLADVLVYKRTNDKPTMDFIRRYFERFRWAGNRHISPQVIEKKAKQHKVHIFHGDECYNENGLCQVIYNGLDTAVVTTFIKNWATLIDHRTSVCVRLLREQKDLMVRIAAEKALVTKHTKELLRTRFEVDQYFEKILENIELILKCEFFIDQYILHTGTHTALIRMWTEKKAFLETNNLEPNFNMSRPGNVPVVSDIDIVSLAR